MNYSSIKTPLSAQIFAHRSSFTIFLPILLTWLLALILWSISHLNQLCQETTHWLLQLKEFNITVVTPRGLRIQALLANSLQCEPLYKDLPYQEVCSLETIE